jgi:hypothetical protein
MGLKAQKKEAGQPFNALRFPHKYFQIFLRDARSMKPSILSGLQNSASLKSLFVQNA